MLKHFYRLMVVALGLFLASSCGKSTPLYGIEETDYDDGTVDVEAADVDTVDVDLRDDDPYPEYAAPDTDYFDFDKADDDAADGDEQIDEDAPPDEDVLPSDEDGADDGDAVEDIPDMDDDEYADETVYGCVGCKFDVLGAVVDAQGNPLKDIEVVVEQLDNPYAQTTAKTNAEGVFIVALNSNYGCNINEDSAVTVTFNDTDGAANGGNFESKEVSLNLPWKAYEWEPCIYEKNDIEVKLDKVGNDDDTLLKD